MSTQTERQPAPSANDGAPTSCKPQIAQCPGCGGGVPEDRLDLHKIHAKRSTRLLQSAGDSIELTLASLRSELELAGPIPADREAAISQTIRAATELRNVATPNEAPTR